MDDADSQLLDRLIGLAERIARGAADGLPDLDALAAGSSPRIAALAEAFGMMAVQVQTRQFRLELLVEDLMRANLDTLELLGAAIAKRDSDTSVHNYRVTLYSVRLAEAAGLGRDDVVALVKGAFLHDIGKIGTPDAILLKPGRLTDDEFAVMKEHVAHGLDIVGRARWLADAAAVVGCHHEKFGGGGYPRGLAGAEIPVTARVFAIADVFDALTSRRPYKEPFPYDRAAAIMREGRGGHFDPDLLDAFLAIAPDLHGRFGGSEDDQVMAVVHEIRRRYFG